MKSNIYRRVGNENFEVLKGANRLGLGFCWKSGPVPKRLGTGSLVGGSRLLVGMTPPVPG